MVHFELWGLLKAFSLHRPETTSILPLLCFVISISIRAPLRFFLIPSLYITTEIGFTWGFYFSWGAFRALTYCLLKSYLRHHQAGSMILMRNTLRLATSAYNCETWALSIFSPFYLLMAYYLSCLIYSSFFRQSSSSIDSMCLHSSL